MSESAKQPEWLKSSPQEELEPLDIKRIAADNPRLLEIIKENQGTEMRNVFGLQKLKIIESLQKDLKSIQDPSFQEVGQSFIDASLRQSLHELQNIATNPDNQYADIGFSTLIDESIEDPKIKDQLKQLYPNAFVEDSDGQTFVVSDEILPTLLEMPLPLYKKILERHIECYQKKDQELQKRVPEMQRQFLTRLEKQISENNLAVNPKTVQEKIKRVRVVLGDYLLYSDFTSKDGDFDPQNAVVVLQTKEVSMGVSSEVEKRDHQEQVYTHEMMHALSGLSVLGSHNEKGEIKIADIQRIGLLLGERFRWLNEAMTERLSLRLLDKKDSNAYKKERQILELLISRGVSEQLFEEAYFEDQSPKSNSKKDNSFKKLVKSINEKFGEGYLQRLDKIVDEFGVESALMEVNSPL